MVRTIRKKAPEPRRRGRRKRDVEGPVIAPMPPATSGQLWAWALAVAVLSVAVYWNSLNCGFVNWDDRGYIKENPLVTGDGGLAAIWLDVFKDKPAEQYYPMVFSTYWIEHRLVKLEPKLYHAVQVGLHALVAVVVLFALRGLGAPLAAAGVAAALFAVHPINVASVVWLAERKNTLSGLFFWLALLLYLQFRRSGGPWRYGLAIVCYQLALFSKTAALVLAPVLVVTDRLLDRRWSLASLRRAAPFFLLGIVMALVTTHVERLKGTSGTPIEPSLRPLVAAAAIAHYIVKLLVPVNLVPVYPRWPESFTYVPYWMAVAGLVVAFVAGWMLRRRFSDLTLWCVAFFLLTLFPMLGFVHFNFLQFSFVSDHFMYLTGVGLFLAVGLAAHRFAQPPPFRTSLTDEGTGEAGAPAAGLRAFRRPRVAAVSLALLAATTALSILTVRQNRVWTSPETFWLHTLRYNPDCFAGAFNLGNHYYRNGAFEAALPFYQEAARLNPTHVNSPKSCARVCAKLDRVEEAMGYYRQAVEVARKKSPKHLATRAEYADYLRRHGKLDEAKAQYEACLEVNPRYTRAVEGLERVEKQMQRLHEP